MLFGYNSKYQSLSNFALDRIELISESKELYKENNIIDLETYFDDVVGVSVHADKESEKVLLKINIKSWPYIKSKPLHGSQRIIEKTDNYVTIEIDVQINHELKALLFHT